MLASIISSKRRWSEMLAFSNDYYGFIFRATQSVELFCAYNTNALALSNSTICILCTNSKFIWWRDRDKKFLYLLNHVVLLSFLYKNLSNIYSTGSYFFRNLKNRNFLWNKNRERIWPISNHNLSLSTLAVLNKFSSTFGASYTNLTFRSEEHTSELQSQR